MLLSTPIISATVGVSPQSVILTILSTLGWLVVVDEWDDQARCHARSCMSTCTIWMLRILVAHLAHDGEYTFVSKHGLSSILSKCITVFAGCVIGACIVECAGAECSFSSRSFHISLGSEVLDAATPNPCITVDALKQTGTLDVLELVVLLATACSNVRGELAGSVASSSVGT